MPRLLRTLPLIALLGLSSPLTAQETGTAEPTGDADAVAQQLDLGENEAAAEGELQLGQTYKVKDHGDWELQCIKTTQEKDPCQIYQLLKDAEGNPVAEFSLFRLPEGGQAIAGATVVVPLETLLTEQLTIGIDSQKAKRYSFSFCNRVGCYARIGLTSADIAQYKAGAAGQLVIVPFAAPDQKVVLKLSLKGFTAGFNEVTVLQN